MHLHALHGGPVLNPAVLVRKYWAANAPVEGWPSLGRVAITWLPAASRAELTWATVNAPGAVWIGLLQILFFKMFLCKSILYNI